MKRTEARLTHKKKERTTGQHRAERQGTGRKPHINTRYSRLATTQSVLLSSSWPSPDGSSADEALRRKTEEQQMALTKSTHLRIADRGTARGPHLRYQRAGTLRSRRNLSNGSPVGSHTSNTWKSLRGRVLTAHLPTRPLDVRAKSSRWLSQSRLTCELRSV